jgi:flagellar assembly protein FliH
MSNVIDSSKMEKSSIQKYHFKVIGNDMSQSAQERSFEPKEEPKETQAPPIRPAETLSSPPIAEEKPPPKPKEDPAQSTFVEELLKKTDELGSNVIKMQMQMEAQAADFAKRLEDEKRRAFEDGEESGQKSAHDSFAKELDSLRSRFNSSIAKIDKIQNEYEKKLVELEHNLSTVAIDIAKEVIDVEVDAKSHQIATALAKSLVEQIKDATHIEIKVSMDDFDFVKEAFSNSKNIEIIADDAIASGGVILLSDIGNIDGDLDVRLQKVKELLLDHKE